MVSQDATEGIALGDPVPWFSARTVSGATLLDYGELPDAIWRRVAPLAGLALDRARIARMQEEARFHAKDPTRRTFSGDAARNCAVSDRVRTLVAELVEPLYRALDRRRIVLGDPAAAITEGA